MNTEVMFSSKDNTWETPHRLFNALNKRFQFTLDVCALPETAKCERYFTPQMDGLSQSWAGERCWMNPPYGKGKDHNIMDWVRKARESAQEGALVVGLLFQCALIPRGGSVMCWGMPMSDISEEG